ncbi:hypothetical protein Gogos_021990 [Gossypium gossypioides]|uniref:DUF4283 domain-containing protein n=1 Tax=Gossypium gossypioides TaxID=34282 RepID=A0A7J9D2X2_GOSGO|nr:hypothetical protein [Gossypium gossypioides]
MHRLWGGEDPMAVRLVTVDFWVLVLDLPHGFMSELGAIRIRAHLDIRRPLKRKKKDLEFRRDISLRAWTRRAVVSTSIWLREEDDSRVLVSTARNLEIVRIREKMSKLPPLNFGANWGDGQVGGSIKLGKSYWTLSVSLSSGASNGSIGGIIRSCRIGPLGMDLDEEIGTVEVDTPIMHIEGRPESAGQSVAMKLFCWNIRGLGNPQTICCLQHGVEGLSLGWKQHCIVSLRSFPDSHIDVLVDEDANGKC